MKLKKKYNCSLETIPGELWWKVKKKRTLPNPIFYHAESGSDNEDRDMGVGLYSKTKKFLIEHKNLVDRTKYVNVWAAMDVLIDWPEVCHGLEVACSI